MQRAFRLEPKTWKLIALAALVAAAAIGFWPYLAPALRLLLGGGAIAFLLDPLCQRLCVRLKRPLAAGVAILGVAAALIGLVLLLAPFMVRQVGALADAIPSSVAAVRALVERVEGFFRNEGIDVSHVKRCVNGEKLGLTFTEILSPTQSSILMYREGVADLMLHPDDVDEAYVASSKSLLISGTSLCCSPTREAALKALTFAQRHDVTVIFDADYRAYTWKNKDEISIYTSLVAQKSDIILGSREEFDLMERLLGLDGTDKASAAYWLGQGAKLLVIKHGKEGSMAYTAEESWKVKPFPVAAMKGFGGGDGYASACLHGLMTGRSLPEAL